MVPTGDKVAQASASWLSRGLFKRQILLQAAPSFSQPRPITRWVRPGLCMPLGLFPHSVLRERLIHVGVVTGDRRPQHGATLYGGHREIEVGEACASARLRGGQVHKEGVDARSLQSVVPVTSIEACALRGGTNR